MLVLGVLRRPQFARLHLAVGADFELLGVERWQDTLDAIKTRPIEIAVVDPAVTGEPRVQQLDRLRSMFPSLPIVVYTHLTPESAALLLDLGRLGIRRALFIRHDDHPARLRDELFAEREHSVACQLIESLRHVFAPLPPVLRSALEAALADPAAIQTVDELARRAAVDRRTLQRWLTRAGLAPPHVVLAAARLLHAYALLQDPGYTVDDVAQRLGYGQIKTLQHHAREVFGVPPGEARLSTSHEEALAAVQARITRGDADSSRQVS